MCNRIKLIVLTLLVSLSVHAQKPPVKFGDVSMDELKMTSYDKDSSAAAVVLADYGESTIRYSQNLGFQLSFDRITRIKILKKDGYEWGNFEIPLYHDNDQKEKLTSFKGVTYNLVNGKIEETKFKNSAMFEEEYTKNMNILKIAMPDVKEGSVVEVSYNVLSDFLVNFQDWTFQRTIPVVWSEYRARIPEFFTYDKYMQGYVGLAVSEEKENSGSILLTFKERGGMTSGSQYYNDKVDYREKYYRWAAQDVPAFKSEPYLTTYKDYISKINFELAYIKYPDQPMRTILGNWDDISKKFNEFPDFGGEVRGNGFLKKTVEEVTAGSSTQQEKVASIYHYVQRSVEWNGQSKMFVDGSIRKVLDQKKGSTADINLLLTSMLDKAGIETYPVLISTRDHGFIRKEIPIMGQFNSVVCLVVIDGKSYLFDASEKLLEPGVLPERCLNGEGLVVSANGGRWVSLNSGVKSRTAIDANLLIDENGTVSGTSKMSLSGYHACDNRKKYLARGEEKYMEEFLDGKTWTVEETSFKNVTEVKEPFECEFQVKSEDHVVVAGEVMYIKPFLVQEEENPFRLEKREYPVDFGSPFSMVYVSRLTIPEGYAVDEIPQSKILAMPENTGRYTYSATQTGNSIIITSMMLINKPIFTQLEYPNLREFYNQVITKQAEQIVLKKVN